MTLVNLVKPVARAASMAIVVVTAAFTGACPKAGTDPTATTATAAPSPAWWMSLRDGKLHRGIDEAPIGLYAAGTMQGDAFVPGGDIEGQGQIGDVAEGTKGWLDLKTGKFIAKSEPQPPPPYVEGSMTSGGFVPSSRKVAY